MNTLEQSKKEQLKELWADFKKLSRERQQAKSDVLLWADIAINEMKSNQDTTFSVERYEDAKLTLHRAEREMRYIQEQIAEIGTIIPRMPEDK